MTFLGILRPELGQALRDEHCCSHGFRPIESKFRTGMRGRGWVWILGFDAESRVGKESNVPDVREDV